MKEDVEEIETAKAYFYSDMKQCIYNHNNQKITANRKIKSLTGHAKTIGLKQLYPKE